MKGRTPFKESGKIKPDQWQRFCEQKSTPVALVLSVLNSELTNRTFTLTVLARLDMARRLKSGEQRLRLLGKLVCRINMRTLMNVQSTRLELGKLRTKKVGN